MRADSRYLVEVVTEESEGRPTRTIRILRPDLLIRREAEALLAAGYDNCELQGLLLVAARRLAIDGTPLDIGKRFVASGPRR